MAISLRGHESRIREMSAPALSKYDLSDINFKALDAYSRNLVAEAQRLQGQTSLPTVNYAGGVEGDNYLRDFLLNWAQTHNDTLVPYFGAKPIAIPHGGTLANPQAPEVVPEAPVAAVPPKDAPSNRRPDPESMVPPPVAPPPPAPVPVELPVKPKAVHGSTGGTAKFTPADLIGKNPEDSIVDSTFGYTYQGPAVDSVVRPAPVPIFSPDTDAPSTTKRVNDRFSPGKFLQSSPIVKPGIPEDVQQTPDRTPVSVPKVMPEARSPNINPPRPPVTPLALPESQPIPAPESPVLDAPIGKAMSAPIVADTRTSWRESQLTGDYNTDYEQGRVGPLGEAAYESMSQEILDAYDSFSKTGDQGPLRRIAFRLVRRMEFLVELDKNGEATPEEEEELYSNRLHDIIRVALKAVRQANPGEPIDIDAGVNAQGVVTPPLRGPSIDDVRLPVVP